MSRTPQVTPVLAALCLASCGASTQSFVATDFRGSLESKTLHLVLENASGAKSSIVTGMSQSSVDMTVDGNTLDVESHATRVGTSHRMNGENQALIAAQDLAFELTGLGFQLVGSPERAEIIATFTIGAVRYDPLAGWIADQAFLVLRDAHTSKVLVSCRAKTRFVTPTVRTIVRNLAREVRSAILN